MAPEPIVPKPPEPETTREFYDRRTDVENYGPTPGCERCRRISEKLPARGTHTEECRNRMKLRGQEVEQERFAKYEEKKFMRTVLQQEREEQEERQRQAELQ